uniref:Uncharacterized protein n=1 Tax=Pseudomonas phage RVTF4 TaxID=3236931 RepID=A0AB39CCS9_9VIRU
MSYRDLAYTPILGKGISRDMIKAIAIGLYGLDEPIVGENDEFIHCFKWEVQDAQLLARGRKKVNVVYGRHYYTSIYLEPGHNPSEAFVIESVRKHILETAFRRDRCLNGLTEVTRYTYSRLGCDMRPDGAFKVLGNGLALNLWREPKFRTDMDDIGRQITSLDLHNMLYRFVPKEIHPHVEHMIRQYAEQWNRIYEGTPGIIHHFTRQKAAGEQLFITTGNGLTGVTFQFNRVNILDKDTLRPDHNTLSLLKEFT